MAISSSVYPPPTLNPEIEELRKVWMDYERQKAAATDKIRVNMATPAGRLICDPVKNGWIINYKGVQYVAKGDKELADEIIRILTNEAMTPVATAGEAQSASTTTTSYLFDASTLANAQLSYDVATDKYFYKAMK